MKQLCGRLWQSLEGWWTALRPRQATPLTPSPSGYMPKRSGPLLQIHWYPCLCYNSQLSIALYNWRLLSNMMESAACLLLAAADALWLSLGVAAVAQHD